MTAGWSVYDCRMISIRLHIMYGLRSFLSLRVVVECGYGHLRREGQQSPAQGTCLCSLKLGTRCLHDLLPLLLLLQVRSSSFL